MKTENKLENSEVNENFSENWPWKENDEKMQKKEKNFRNDLKIRENWKFLEISEMKVTFYFFFRKLPLVEKMLKEKK